MREDLITFIEEIKNKDESYLDEYKIREYIRKLLRILGWDTSNNEDVYSMLGRVPKKADFILKIEDFRIFIYVTKEIEKAYIDEILDILSMEFIESDEGYGDHFVIFTNGTKWRFLIIDTHEPLIYEKGMIKQKCGIIDLDLHSQDPKDIIYKLTFLLCKDDIKYMLTKIYMKNVSNDIDIKDISTIVPSIYPEDAIDLIYEKMKGELSHERIRKLLSYSHRLKTLDLYEVSLKEGWTEKKVKDEIKNVTDKIIRYKKKKIKR